MKLTGKCDIAFNEYCKNKGLENFNNRSYALVICKSFWNTLFIDFFDSVGIYISIEHNQNVVFMYILDECCENGFLTRQEATEKAIEKANLIYNDRV